MKKYRMNCLSISKYSLLVFLISTNNSFSQSNLQYLGKPLPTDIPERFASDDLLATSEEWWHGSPVFSPEGDELYFATYHDVQDSVKMFYKKYENGEWSAKMPVPFANKDSENDPQFSPDGRSLYYMSLDESEGNSNLRLVRIDRKDSERSKPEIIEVPFPDEKDFGWYFSLARNKNLYLEIWENDGGFYNLYVSKFMNGKYSTPELLKELNSNTSDNNPFIDLEERFIIFNSRRLGTYGRSDLYIAFRDSDGSWKTPVNLGANINGPGDDSEAHISNDGRYFFFTSERDGDLGYNPYWVKSDFLFELDRK